ncbi:SWIM zinc finger family protein [Leptothermofonsia sichuanensis E412]|uniref:SWIM zinc finger family protein n=1 Tax=Leptothermofonsia sichuanensis TaxID=2917832 RepID=UPI001CA773D2|nr:SWIM zinc finger family protein [Leptothermofonsia sichuanensis]QZZ22229.1 SWIM zinc finger family protein [Leptothermofonsia sichuanensis E412]
MTDPSYSPPNREWWAQRWIDVLESFGWVRRLARARVYAREGNVLSIEFKGPKVFALVQGTAPEPYKVALSLDPFSDEQWGYIIESMAERAVFSAKLLAGEMPQTIEEVFTANGLSLFPFTKFDIHSRCSCPDPANPCKHIGAVYYLLGDRFSEDPFVLFQLRGRTKEQIIEALRQIRSEGSGEGTTPKPEVEASEGSRPKTPFPVKTEQFWHYTNQMEPSLVVIAPPPTSETVLDVLGPIPLKPGESGSAASSQPSLETVMDYLKTIYQAASQQAITTAMNGERGSQN